MHLDTWLKERLHISVFLDGEKRIMFIFASEVQIE